MVLEKLEESFSICKVTAIESEQLNHPFTFIAKTDKELSLICPTEFVPDNTTSVEHEWSAFRIAEDAAFEKYGMIAFLSKIIADCKTGVLVVATYDTDYLLIKKQRFEEVCEALKKKECQFM